MESAIERVLYYKEQVRKNEQVWLKTKSISDRKILVKQIETFRKLQLRYSTLAAKALAKYQQLELFK